MSVLYAWRDRRRSAIRQSRDLSPAMKANAYSQLRVEFDAQLATSREQFSQRRALLLEANPLLAWQPWLVARAGQGDAEALQVLGAREHCIQKRVSALLRASDADAIRRILHPVMKQGRVLRDGTVAYDPGDGGRIFDTAEGLQLRGQGVAAALLVLELAGKRYAGQALTISGDINLRLQLADLAALRGIKITFADTDLEQRRREQVASNSVSKGAAIKLAKDQAEKTAQSAKGPGPER